MGFEFFIARRYLRSKRKTGFISLITYISTIGVMIGVAALIISLSVANGFEDEVRSRIIGFDAHIKVRTFHDRGMDQAAGERIIAMLDSLPQVKGAAPYIFEKGMIVSKERKEGVLIKAIDPKREPLVTNLVNNIIYGSLNLDMVHVEGERDYPGIILGRWLADRLVTNLGDRVQILSASGLDLSPLGGAPRFRTFRVAGYFETGLYEYDDNYAFISIEQGQKLFESPGKITGVQVKLDNMNHAKRIAEWINRRLGYPYMTITWFSMNKNLFAWMQIEKWAAFLILSLIIMVAAFNIVSTLIMVVLEKRKDIGILKSMGAYSSSILKIFVFEGLFAGIIGVILGLLIGYGFCWAQLKYKFFSLPGEVYIINSLPIQLQWIDFFSIAAAALFLSFVATLYPAYKAAKLDPIEAIRYE
ncbi:MAG: lipoprotein-releasing ABC transporter permease subunit [Calditrichaeota bacterium]|nr:MAG: lipoprotein-releasing ABC transporter permease subunit [Calditrichota bacterium]